MHTHTRVTGDHLERVCHIGTIKSPEPHKKRTLCSLSLAAPVIRRFLTSRQWPGHLIGCLGYSVSPHTRNIRINWPAFRSDRSDYRMYPFLDRFSNEIKNRRKKRAHPRGNKSRRWRTMRKRDREEQQPYATAIKCIGGMGLAAHTKRQLQGDERSTMPRMSMHSGHRLLAWAMILHSFVWPHNGCRNGSESRQKVVKMVKGRIGCGVFSEAMMQQKSIDFGGKRAFLGHFRSTR